MANEYSYSAAGDVRVAALLNREVQFLLMDPTDIRSTLTQMPFDAMGSAALKTGQFDMDGAMAAPGQVTQVNNTALVDGSFTLTVAHYALQHEIGFLNEITSGQNDVGVSLVAQKVLGAATLTLTDLVTTLFGSVSATTGSTGVDLDVDDIFDAQFTLHSALVPGPYNCVLYQQQTNDFITSLRGETGAMQWQQATADMLSLKGPGFQGTWNGIQFWSSDSVPTANAGADSAGCMYGPGAFAYTEAPVDKVIPYATGQVVREGSRIYVAINNIDDYGKTRLNGHYFPAASIAENARAVAIVTDR